MDTFEQRLAYVENKHYNRWFNHKKSQITTKRVTNEEFDKKFRTFMAALVKNKLTRIENHIEDQYFDDNSDDWLNFAEFNSEDILDCSEDFSDVSVNLSYSDDEINNSAEEVAMKEDDYSNNERKNFEGAEDELNVILNASSRQKTKIRAISNTAQQILITNIVVFNNAPSRSIERADIKVNRISIDLRSADSLI